jgi:hypothetical protein
MPMSSILPLPLPLALTLALVLTCPLASAHEKDSLASAACKQALAALQEQEVAVADGPGDRTTPQYKQAFARLQAQRSKAAHDCLGGRLEAAPPPRNAARATIPVHPRTPESHSPTTPSTTASTPSTPTRGVPEPLRSITSCDAAGCWASDAARLQRLGPNLVGPRGVCTVQGAVLSCP